MGRINERYRNEGEQVEDSNIDDFVDSLIPTAHTVETWQAVYEWEMKGEKEQQRKMTGR